MTTLGIRCLATREARSCTTCETAKSSWPKDVNHLYPDYDLMKKMLDPSPSYRPSIQEAVDLLENLIHKELKDKRPSPEKGSFELGSSTLDEKKLKKGGGDFGAYQFRGFSNKFIPAEDYVRPQGSPQLGCNTLAFTDTMKDCRMDKITKTDTTKIDFDDFANEQLDENPRVNMAAKGEINQRNMVCKTLTNLKSKSTFAEGASPQLKNVPMNASIIFGNESTLRPHKGSSDLFYALTPTSKSTMER